MRIGNLLLCGIFMVGTAYAYDVTDRKTVTSKKYVDDQIATKQPILNPNNTNLRDNVVMYTNQAGTVAAKPISTTLSGTGIDNNLPTVGAVNTGIATKQDEIGAVNTNTVVTYTDTAGTLGQKGIYQDTGTYAAQSDNLIQASTFNAALRNGLENEFLCADTGPVSNQCWLWSIDNATEETLLPDGYTPLEYIESTGTQYIGTGIIGGAGLSIDLVAQGTGDNGIIVGFDQDWGGAFVAGPEVSTWNVYIPQNQSAQNQ